MLLNHGYVYPLDEIGRRNLDVDKLSVANSYNFVEHIRIYAYTFVSSRFHTLYYLHTL